MYTHIIRSVTSSFMGFKRYRLSVRIYVDREDLQIIQHHRLELIEFFHDPIRDELNANASAAHEKVKGHRLIVTTMRDAGTICTSEIRTLVSTVRALLTFQVTLADLLQGVSITHRSLQAIGEIEHVLTECIDRIDHFVRAARSYSDEAEDIFAPGTDADPTIPPAEWPQTWTR